jgi:mannose-6-phosphate isomerase-like protein (cupin superfamily)
MQFITSGEFTGDRAWAALDIADIEGASVRLHWTDTPYKWHVNDGEEVFVVLSGQVDMRYKDDTGAEHIRRMAPGDIFHAGAGDAHVAHPIGPARVLVVEKKGSV